MTKSFPDDLDASRQARDWVEETSELLGFHAEPDALRLMVSELVTNAVRYCGDDVQVTVYVHDCGIWVSVADDGAGRVHQCAPGPWETHGRGLAIVEAMSTAWGVVTERSGKAVWFEIANRGDGA